MERKERESARLCERAEELWPRIRELIDEVLTERQREAVLLHCFEELNQRQIAGRLGLSQQSVSEHPYGKAQKDRRLGGRCASSGRRVRSGAYAGSRVT